MAVGTTVDAKKTKLGPEDALKRARAAKRIVVAKGKRVVEVDVAKELPDDATLLKLLLGTSGTLRAPTLVVGDVLLVGFNDEAYDAVFG